MEVSQFNLAIFCFASIIEGMILGSVYDVFCVVFCAKRENTLIFRKKLQSINLSFTKQQATKMEERYRSFRALPVFLCDLIFMLLAGVSISLLVYRFNDGKWRLATVTFLLLGYILYRKLLRQIVLSLLGLCAFLVRCFFDFILRLTVVPIKHLAYAVFRSVSGGIRKVSKQFFECRILKYSEKEKAEILRNAENHGMFCSGYKKGG